MVNNKEKIEKIAQVEIDPESVQNHLRRKQIPPCRFVVFRLFDDGHTWQRSSK